MRKSKETDEASELMQSSGNRQGSVFWKVIVTFGGVGYIPYAPGTAGSFTALLPALLILEYTAQPSLWLIILICIFTILGVIGSSKMEKSWGKDSSRIVVDEVVGMWISLLFFPAVWTFTILSFILFRFFDIFKPIGIKKVQNLKGGYGVMADDILAGIAANLVVQGIFHGFYILMADRSIP